VKSFLTPFVFCYGLQIGENTRVFFNHTTTLLCYQVNTKSGNGVTAMQQAAAEGHSEVVDLLLAAGAAVNACPMSNATALYNAANGGHLEVVDRLVITGADVDLKTSSGSTPLHAASSGGHTEVRLTLQISTRSREPRRRQGLQLAAYRHC